MLRLFAATIFLGSALLFVVQPMIARMMLPLLGGSPSVWNGCMLFFQGVLLAGYLYAHVIGSVGRRPVQVVIHGAVLLASVVLFAVIPPGIPKDATPPVEGSPVLFMLGALAEGIGVPFLMLSTGSSLLQRFFSRTDHPAAADPYFLYSASNAGSLLGLLGYPILIEPVFTLGQQQMLFAGAYVTWAALTVVCALWAMRRPSLQVVAPAPSTPEGAPTAPGLSRRVTWILLAFVPSSLLLSETMFITTDVAAVPFLWVVPLGIYLITFIVAFSRRGTGMVRWSGWLLLPVAAVTVAVVAGGLRTPLVAIAGVHLALLLVGALACHGRLAALRPPASGLTEFYLWIAVGGVLGGLFNALAAPLLFLVVDEYAVTVALLLVVAVPDFPRLRARANSMMRVGGAAVAAITLLISLRASGSDESEVIHRARTFFGVYRVVSTGGGLGHTLYHGTTMHGRQAYGRPGDDSERRRFQPMSYYHPNGPIGQVMQLKWEAQPPGFDEVGLVGLGVGTLAAYGQEKRQRFTFYEIDPAVVEIASDPKLFTFLSDSDATVSIVLGDARIMLGKEPDQKFDVLVLDAFSSDAIPVHLLTKEAVQLYMTKLKPTGMLAVHVSNRHLDLTPTVGQIAKAIGAAAFVRYDRASSATAQDAREGKSGSTWIVVSKSVAAVGPLATDRRWQRYENLTTGRPWTDDYSNIISVMRWK